MKNSSSFSIWRHTQKNEFKYLMSYLFILRIWKNVCALSTRPQTSIGCLLSLGSETALHCKQAWFCHRNHYMGSGTLTEIIVCEDSSLCHPQMQVKYHEKWSPEKLLSSLGQNSFKIHLSKVEACSVVRFIKIWNLFFWKPWMPHPLISRRAGPSS